MKKYLILLLYTITSIIIQASNQKQTLHGYIRCNEKGVENVLVTDGVSFTRTQSDGKYILQSSGNQEYIYYTLPSGYESPIENGVPLFYKKIEADSKDYNFELYKAPISQSKHSFIVWADPQVIDTLEFELLDEVVRDINQTKSKYKNIPMHAISCGDIVFDRLNLFDNYKQVIKKTELPFYQVIGNHDLNYSNQTNETSTKSYREKFGPDFYSFNKGNIHYITLNNVFYYGYSYHYMGYLDQRQLNWLEQDLSYIPKGSTIIISLHIPTMYLDADTHPSMEKRQKNSLINNNAFYEYLKGYNVHILAGHSHTQWNTVITDSILEHTHAAASAAWWQGKIGLDGTPKGYTVYEVDGNNLSWYFKGVDYSKDSQFKVYPIGADIDNPGCFVANVYNYDPQWKVVWYEDGILQGDMIQYWGVDPLARDLYQPGKNKKYSWLGYDKTNHLFKAIPNNKNAKIKIEATDRFGKKYIQFINGN